MEVIMNFKGRKDLTEEESFWAKVRIKEDDDCWEWLMSISNSGYGRFCYNQTTDYAHRVAWRLSTKGDIPNGKIICHTCDNKICCNPRHLYLGTYSNNAEDKMERNPHRVGSISRFHDGDVWYMRQLYLSGVSQRRIADMFKTTQSHISQLINNKVGSNVMPQLKIYS